MCGSSPSPPAPPPPPPAPPELPRETDEAVKRAREDERRRARAAVGRSGTILTGGTGLTAPATTEKKTLLGQ
jgi:hypothetical protein